MELKEFVHQVASGARALLDEYNDHPLAQSHYPPKDLRRTLSNGRRVAEEIILLTDVDEARSHLQQDPEALRDVLLLTSDFPFEDQKLAVDSAYEAMRHEPTILPFFAYCSYLIELCNALERGLQPPESGESKLQ